MPDSSGHARHSSRADQRSASGPDLQVDSSERATSPTQQMIASHAHRYIFLKAPKTAGSSIEIALSRFCGPSDIITHIDADDDAARARLGYRGPQNCIQPLGLHSWRGWRRLVLRVLRGERRPRKWYHSHMFAKETCQKLGRRTWDAYYKFCVVRNPWDRLISFYYWRCQDMNPRPSFSDWISPDNIKKQKAILHFAIDGKIAVDQIVRFESLRDDLELVRRRIGLPEPLVLPRFKADTREDRRPYREVYKESERRLVEMICADEIELLGYEF